MKNLNALLIICILTFVSCEIREPEDKPDMLKPGEQMFYICSQNIGELCNLMDKVLLLENYQNSNDADKEIFRNRYFSQYNIMNDGLNTYYYIQKDFKDTAFTVITNNKSIFLNETTWKVRAYNRDSFCSISCVDVNKWEIKSKGIRGCESSDSLQFHCLDSSKPLLFQTNRFSIIGNGVLVSEGQYPQDIRISYKTTQPLILDSTSHNILQGEMDMEAENLKTKRNETSKIRFFLNDKNQSKYELTYQDRIKTKDNFYFFWY